jgi:hypothetical protein
MIQVPAEGGATIAEYVVCAFQNAVFHFLELIPNRFLFLLLNCHFSHVHYTFLSISAIPPMLMHLAMLFKHVPGQSHGTRKTLSRSGLNRSERHERRQIDSRDDISKLNADMLA